MRQFWPRNREPKKLPTPLPLKPRTRHGGGFRSNTCLNGDLTVQCILSLEAERLYITEGQFYAFHSNQRANKGQGWTVIWRIV